MYRVGQDNTSLTPIFLMPCVSIYQDLTDFPQRSSFLLELPFYFLQEANGPTIVIPFSARMTNMGVDRHIDDIILDL
jgi:hypothetical protein